MFNWFAATARKSDAAQALEAFLRISREHGAFPGDPAKTANQLIDLGCTRAPQLPDGRYRKYVLAAACLSVALSDADIPDSLRPHIAIALQGLVAAAKAQRHKLSFDELDMVAVTSRMADEFALLFPQQMASATTGIQLKSVEALLHPAKALMAPSTNAQAKTETSHDRKRAMQELINRMR